MDRSFRRGSLSEPRAAVAGEGDCVSAPGPCLRRSQASHRVTVREDDVVYAGRHYKSLSEVARAITGARWSGPLFFGLRERAKEEANG